MPDLERMRSAISQPSTIGVVLPSLNCAHLLPDHLDSMHPWLDLAEQIVVVDSHSEDGTWEMLRERLAGHPGAEFHQRPRGLYQSWNYGIGQLKTEFTYISTIGDSITRTGLEHLRGVAAEFKADVVVSKPVFIEEEGGVCSHQTRWPIDSVIDELAISTPVLMDNWSLLLFLMENPVDAILGSSASNLYRTATLQSRPFPTEYGTVGDGAWGLTNIFDPRLAVTPERFSTFRRHAKSYRASDYEAGDLNRRLFDLLASTLQAAWRRDPDKKMESERLQCGRLLEIVQHRISWQKQLEDVREWPVPWIFNPLAWRARNRRNYYKAEALARRNLSLQKIAAANFDNQLPEN